MGHFVCGILALNKLFRKVLPPTTSPNESTGEPEKFRIVVCGCRFSSLAICKSKFVENERDQIRSAMESIVWSPVWSSLSKYKQINRRLIIIPLNFVSLNQRDALSTSSCLAFCLQLIAAGNARHVCPARLGSARLNCCAAIPSNSLSCSLSWSLTGFLNGSLSWISRVILWVTLWVTLWVISRPF